MTYHLLPHSSDQVWSARNIKLLCRVLKTATVTNQLSDKQYSSRRPTSKEVILENVLQIKINWGKRPDNFKLLPASKSTKYPIDSFPNIQKNVFFFRNPWLVAITAISSHLWVLYLLNQVIKVKQWLRFV